LLNSLPHWGHVTGFVDMDVQVDLEAIYLSINMAVHKMPLLLNSLLIFFTQQMDRLLAQQMGNSFF
jgi:hypothetical protein